MCLASRLRLIAPLVLATLAIGSGADAQRLCALRDGPKGPCTCKVAGAAAGEFQVVSKRHCAKALRDDAAPEAAAPEAAADERAAARSPMPTETGAIGAGTAGSGAASPAAAPPAADADAPPVSGRLATVRARGKLLCGVNTDLVGFSSLSDTGLWQGLDADFCRAVAAAIFDDATKVEFVPVETNARFEMLLSGQIDLLARNTTWTMSRDVDMGLAFAGVLYFDGQGFMTGNERGLVSAQQLAGLTICVEAGTTTEANMAYYFAAHQLSVETQSYPGRKEMLDAYIKGTCDAYSGDRSALFSDRAGFADPSKHAILPEVISKEPLGPVVVQGDPVWTEIVRWTLAGLINAEEVGLDRAKASGKGALADDALRLVDGAGASGAKLGLSKTWLRTVVSAVGNYGEMFEANVGKHSPLGMERGINALWKRGGIQFAPPMW